MKCIVPMIFILLSFGVNAESMTTNSVTVACLQTNSLKRCTNKMEDAQCTAITKSGKRCKRRHAQGSYFCKQHKLIDERKKKNGL